MNELSIDFLFDFGSPNAYLSHAVIPSMEQRLEVKFQYVPILLGGLFKLTGNRSPAETTAEVQNKPEYLQRDTERFIARHGISEFRWNPYFPVNTLLTMRLAIAAQREGEMVFMKLVDAVFAAMWEQELNIADETAVREALTLAGLDGERLLGQAQEPDVKEELKAHTQQAFERGAFGAPTFYLDNEMFFGKDRLRELEDEILRRQNLKR